MKRIITAALTLALTLPMLISCKGESEEKQKMTIDSEYVIIRAENASERVKNAAKELKSAYKELGLDLEIKSDWIKDNSDISEKEILVGETNRKESENALPDGADYAVVTVGEKPVFCSTSDSGVAKAVSEYIAAELQNNANWSSLMPNKVLLSGNFDPLTENVTFLWKDGEKSVIKGGSWAPRVYSIDENTLIAGVETSSGIRTLKSTDNGNSFKKDTKASFHDNLSCANVNFFGDGEKLYLAYRATGQIEGGFYTSLQMSVSTDEGKTWEHHSTIAENIQPDGAFRGVWEPYLGLLDGKLTCFYANDSSSVTAMQNIEYKVYENGEWGERTVVSEGTKHNSRDGMPVWMQLSSGEYVCAIESSSQRDNGYPFVIQLLYSKDGKSWSAPTTIYTPKTKGSKAGAPGIAELPSGQIVVSFQTDEDATAKGDATSVMKSVISDGTNVKKLKEKNFSENGNVFGTPDGEGATWTGIWYYNGWLYAAAGTREGSSLNKIQLY